MRKVKLIATTVFGLEAVVKRELQNLGYEDLIVQDGKVEFEGEPKDIARCNLWLRCAERILLKIGEFQALTFDELFEKTKALPWAELITYDGKFTVNGKSLKSKLFSISDSQAIVKKAIVESLKKKFQTNWFPETGPVFTVEVSLLKNIATITVDTSGEALHKRGYRDRAGDAPLKETLAAGLILLSYWNPKRTLYDPFCGSGTIPIEAALIGRNIAPGIDRSFASEEWPFCGKELFQAERRDALQAVNQGIQLSILGSDIDKRSILRARDNAENIGVNEDISFFMKDMREVDLHNDYGVVVTNPPYGKRMGEDKEVEQLYRDLGKKMRDLDTWSLYLITNHQDFEKLYGKKADRKRKLYNGRIKVDFYQYFGPKPPGFRKENQ